MKERGSKRINEAYPSSIHNPIIDEHPGPPLSHKTVGSLAGSFLDSKK
jgi:hypothetical protein